MSESQSWNFGAIQAGASSIQGAVGRVHALLDEGQGSLAKLGEAWGGSGQEAYHQTQTQWDKQSKELNDSLSALSQRIEEASHSMSQTESGVTGMFS